MSNDYYTLGEYIVALIIVSIISIAIGRAILSPTVKELRRANELAEQQIVSKEAGE